MRTTIRTATPAEADRVARAYAEACVDEAVTGWVFQGDAVPFPALLASLDDPLRGGGVVVAEGPDGIEGVSTWVDSGGDAPHQPAEQPLSPRMAAVLALTAERHPAVPHLYLASMVVLPAARGRGVGSAILRHRLTGERRPVYLEASTPRAARLYARHGFRPLGEEIALPWGGPRLRPMWRDGRRVES
ncbi:GNAT superfamily N-acetyltransferase [Saccharothrix coeruleofusca]|uniref:GNAT family N-acetyltransferase n=1 Tax=Saccharothrix coeruleofusca TaxID=33919 RepID=UPI001AE4B21F|nr:GNAT family N-acetyltransferase [Saccharothrix coeruleofusca]MBP2337971.1 GNAT superfamily N-acetyltransferase [Saccharothrix coeruleofusca]